MHASLLMHRHHFITRHAHCHCSYNLADAACNPERSAPVGLKLPDAVEGLPVWPCHGWPRVLGQGVVWVHMHGPRGREGEVNADGALRRLKRIAWQAVLRLAKVLALQAVPSSQHCSVIILHTQACIYALVLIPSCHDHDTCACLSACVDIAEMQHDRRTSYPVVGARASLSSPSVRCGVPWQCCRRCTSRNARAVAAGGSCAGRCCTAGLQELGQEHDAARAICC